jgi:hypothetical protein
MKFESSRIGVLALRTTIDDDGQHNESHGMHFLSMIFSQGVFHFHIILTPVPLEVFLLPPGDVISQMSTSRQIHFFLFCASLNEASTSFPLDAS